MPDYSLGRAHGKIDIDYDGSGAGKAAKDLDTVATASESADKSLTKTQRTLRDTGREMGSAGTAADGYQRRLKDVEAASRAVETAERDHRDALLDSKSTLDDIKDAEDKVTEAKERHTAATDAERAAQKALAEGLSITGRAISALGGLLPQLNAHLDGLADAGAGATSKAGGLASTLGGLTKVVGLLGPEGKAAAVGIEMAAGAIDNLNAVAGKAIGVVQGLAGFEVEFGKISGLTLGLGSLAGLAGLGGAAGVQGVVDLAGAVKQLSGALGLLPSVVSGVGFVMETLKVTFNGVGDALKDMMATDPKKFLEDIKDMGPATAQAMLDIAQFRTQFLAGGGAVQDSFFSKIAGDIAPLIQTWLPAVVQGMSQVSGVMGDAADQFIKLLGQPQMMAAFTSFVDNVSAGLQALQPAMGPLLGIFNQLTTVGSSFFQQIGGDISQALGTLAGLINQATASGTLQKWIQDGINGFERLGNIVFNLGTVFGNVMDIAERFGGGGLLGWLQQLSEELAKWSQSPEGQKTLTGFFTAVREATDAFTPLMGPLVNGLASLGQAFVQLGTATAPGWLAFMNSFATAMGQLGPQIVGIAPALNQFLTQLGASLVKIVAQVGPQLPMIFESLSNAFVALLPQLPPLVAIFTQLVQEVGPQLPKLFGSFTQLLQALVPLMPTITGFIRDFVSGITVFMQAMTLVAQGAKGVVDAILKIGDAIINLPGTLGKIGDTIRNFFGNFVPEAVQWGKNLVGGLIQGLKDATGLTGITNATKGIVDIISQFFQQSPAKKGPFSGSGYTLIRGQKMVTDMAAGMMSAQPSVEAAAASTAAAASGALSGGSPGRAPAPGGSNTTGSALLPDNIAGANTGVLTAYLQHQFSDTRGLKGLAKDLGQFLQVAQNGFNLLNTHAVQPLFEALGMVPGAKAQGWRKLTPKEMAAQQQDQLSKDNTTKPTWGDVLGPDAVPAGQNLPLGLSNSSSKADIQKAIIAAGRARGMNDAAIQTALATAAAESGFDPTISGGVQGSAGLVSGLYQQSPSSGWGTLDQVNDPNYAINAFYDAYAKNLAKNPDNPQLAAVLTQNPQLGDNAQGSDYWNAISAQLGLGNSILTAYGKDANGKDITGPSWQQLTGSPPATGVPGASSAAGADAAMIAANPASRASTLGGASANYTPATMAAAGIAPLFTKTGSGSMDGAPPWVQELAKTFGLTATSHSDTTLHGGQGQMGDWAFDFAGAVPDMQRFADFIKTNLASQTLQAIWQNPTTGDQLGIAGGQVVGRDQYYTTAGGTYADHMDHVHWATDVAPILNGQPPANANPAAVGPVAQPDDPRRQAIEGAREVAGPGGLQAGTSFYKDWYTPGDTNIHSGTGKLPGPAPTAGDLVLPSGKSLQSLVDDTAKSSTANDRLLQAYLQGNPALADQITAAKVPGADDSTVKDTLGSISTTIATLQAKDPVGNKNTISALQSQQSKIAQQQGFTQQQGPLAQAQSLASGAAGAITGVFQSIQSGLDALAATQDITDRLVYGVRNTEDINKIIDNVQKYITFAADVVSTVGSVLSTAGSFTGGSDFGGTSAAGSILSLVAGVMQGVNAAIDFGQQIYEVASGYVGRFLSFLAAGPGGTDLMGNVGFLLNKNTGQLISYSQDNPQKQNTLAGSSFINGLYGYGQGNTNTSPGVGQLNIYAGPGQSVAATMNEAMWLVNTGGTTGALSPASF